MAQSKTKTPARARIAHKLARYVRADRVHLAGKLDNSTPSISHLRLGGEPTRRLRNSSKTWYPADDEKQLIKRKRNQPKPSTGRKSITPGSVVILLSGNNRGRRVVVLKNLPSNNLLVTGPYAINGVPLKRVNAAYVLATSTKVSLAGVNVNVEDNFFQNQTRFTKNELKNASEAKLKKVEGDKKTAETWKAQAKVTQKAVDSHLLQNIKKVEHLKGYLGTRFTLYNNTRPHELAF